MPDIRPLGPFLIGAGVILILIGLAVTFGGGLLGWFGHLPGDIRIERDNVRVFIPITSMILISVVGTLLLNGIARLLRWLNP